LSRCRRLAGALSLATLLWLTSGLLAVCDAAALRFCDRQVPLSAGQKDTLLRFGGIVKDELEGSGQQLALIARSGLDLSRFSVRYSHAGLSLKASPNTPWSVRQLYYACDEGVPRLYDQGMSGFLLGTDDPAIGYVSLVFLPAAEAAELERVALDNRRALQLLSTAYSANAYPWSLRYQNCNQWLSELLATAWGDLELAAGPDGAAPSGADADARTRAQRWLKLQGYEPSVFDVGYRPLIWLGAALPWLHNDDHPAEDLERAIYRVSMPASIEAFVHAALPQATRVEICHSGSQVVIRRGWEPIAEGCRPGARDTVIRLD
jgi:hypothetical protein